MSDDRAPDLVRPSPLRRRHAEVRRQGITRHIPVQNDMRQLLYGPPGRAIRYPLAAIQGSRDLGPCRHALAQRVVAGQMVVEHHVGLQRPPSPKPGSSS